MKNRTAEWTHGRHEELVATFGEARVLRRGDRVILKGGSMADRIEALEWMAEHLPELTPSLER